MYGFVLATALLAMGAVYPVPADDEAVEDSGTVTATSEAFDTTSGTDVVVTVTDAASPTVSGGSADTYVGHGTVAVAPTEAQAEQAFQQARRSFMAVAQGSADKPMTAAGVSSTAEDTVAGGRSKNVALDHVRIVLDVDNITLREVMVKIVEQAAQYTGPWTVKWRLRPENSDLLDERVNLTAEAEFGDFCSLLTERVKNMTGTQLFVTAFAATRVLLVTDTYY